MTSPLPSLIHRPSNIEVSAALEPSKQVKINYMHRNTHAYGVLGSWLKTRPAYWEDYIWWQALAVYTLMAIYIDGRRWGEHATGIKTGDWCFLVMSLYLSSNISLSALRALQATVAIFRVTRCKPRLHGRVWGCRTLCSTWESKFQNRIWSGCLYRVCKSTYFCSSFVIWLSTQETNASDLEVTSIVFYGIL